MKIQLLTFVLFKIILMSSAGEQRESSNDNKCLSNPNTTSIHNENDSKNDIVTLRTYGRIGLVQKKLRSKIKKLRIFKNEGSEQTNFNHRDEIMSYLFNLDNKSSEETANASKEETEISFILSDHFLIPDKYKTRDSNTKLLLSQIPAEIDMEFIDKHKIPLKTICDLHIFLVDKINLVDNFYKTMPGLIIDVAKELANDKFSRRTFCKDFSDLKGIEVLIEVTLRLSVNLCKFLQFTIKFLDLIRQKNDSVINFINKLKDAEDEILIFFM